MQKACFHDGKYVSENKVQKKTNPLQFTDKKSIVDINKLLYRARIDKKNEIKRKIIFYSSSVLVLGLFLALAMIVN